MRRRAAPRTAWATVAIRRPQRFTRIPSQPPSSASSASVVGRTRATATPKASTAPPMMSDRASASPVPCPPTSRTSSATTAMPVANVSAAHNRCAGAPDLPHRHVPS